MSERRNTVPLIAGTLAALLLLFGAYMGSYYAMVDGYLPEHTSDYRGRFSPFVLRPTYRIGSEAVAVIFWPANQIDRLIRPRVWDGHESPDLFRRQ
jgi:hypothetical protein